MYFTIFILIIVIIFFVIRDKTIFNPIVVFSGIWAVSLFLSTLGLFNMIEITNKAKVILFVGIMSYIIGALFIYIYINFISNNKEKKNQNNRNIEKINYNKIKFLLLIGIAITVPVACKVIVLLVNGTSLGLVRSMYYSYGDATPLIANDTLFTLFDWGTSLILLLAMPTVIIGCMNKDIDKMSIFLLIIYTLLCSISTAGRSQLIVLAFEIFVGYELNRNKINEKIAKVVRIAIVILVVLVMGISIARIGKKNGSVNQLYAYFSLPAPYFSEMVKYIDDTDSSTNGVATFYGPYLFTQKAIKSITGYKLKSADYYYTIVNKPQNNWVKVFKESPDNYNAYCTLFYNFYLDYRIWGVFLFSLLYGIFMEMEFYKLKRGNLYNQIIYLILIIELLFSIIKWGFASPVVIIALIGIRFLIKKEKKIEHHTNSKVLVFGITDIPGGIESVVMNYYRNIDRTKIQFDFLCNTENVAYEEEIKKLGGNIYRVTPRSKSRIKFRKDMNTFFKENHTNYSAIWVNVCSLANIDYLKYAKKYGIEKRVIHSHNSQNMDSFIRGVLHRINRLFISYYATDYWSCSLKAARWFYSNKIIKSEKFKVVKNAIDYNKYSFDEKVSREYKQKLNVENRIVVGNVGRLHFQKNQLFLIDVFERLHRLDNRFSLIVVGDGEERSNIIKRVNELELNDEVQLLGIRQDITEIMQSFDVFIFPSLFEGLPMALLEAQANGLVVFASDSITEEIKMSDNLKFISLKKTAEEWAEIIYNVYKVNNFKRVDNFKNMISNGYEIRAEAKKIERFFERN